MNSRERHLAAHGGPRRVLKFFPKRNNNSSGTKLRYVNFILFPLPTCTRRRQRECNVPLYSEVRRMQTILLTLGNKNKRNTPFTEGPHLCGEEQPGVVLLIHSPESMETNRTTGEKEREREKKWEREDWMALYCYLLPNRYPATLINYDVAQAGASVRY